MVMVSLTTDCSFLSDWIYWLERLNERYSYAALIPLGEHCVILELPGKTRATWSADDEEFFEEGAAEGFIREWTWRFYQLVEVANAHEPDGARSMTMVFLTLQMPYEKFPSFTKTLLGMYPYSALQSLGGHDYVLELPGKSRETWHAVDDRFFAEFLAGQGFLQEQAWHKRFYWIIEDEERSST
jgi:hypothetical protein